MPNPEQTLLRLTRDAMQLLREEQPHGMEVEGMANGARCRLASATGWWIPTNEGRRVWAIEPRGGVLRVVVRNDMTEWPIPRAFDVSQNWINLPKKVAGASGQVDFPALKDAVLETDDAREACARALADHLAFEYRNISDSWARVLGALPEDALRSIWGGLRPG